MTKQQARKNRLKKIKLLIFIWVIFILAVVTGVFLYIKNYKKIKDAVDKKNNKIYETNSIPEVNELMGTYLKALTECDQETLMKYTTDPSAFMDMTDYKNRADKVRGYSDINCYTVEGLNDSDIICFVIAKVTLKDVESTPKDIICSYLVKQDGKYVIDSGLSTEKIDFMNEKIREKDIQALYKKVKADEDKCLKEDETLRKFYEEIGNGGNKTEDISQKKTEEMSEEKSEEKSNEESKK